MALVTMKALLDQAVKEHRGVGAFSVGNMEMVKGAVQAAEELQTPIILQIAEVRLKYSPRCGCVLQRDRSRRIGSGDRKRAWQLSGCSKARI